MFVVFLVHMLVIVQMLMLFVGMLYMVARYFS